MGSLVILTIIYDCTAGDIITDDNTKQNQILSIYVSKNSMILDTDELNEFD